jgi:hypothetical protein
VQVLKAIGTEMGAQYLLILHVKADHAFKKFFLNASQADMPLFRGMFLQVTLSHSPPLPSTDVQAAGVQKLRDTSSRQQPTITSLTFQQAFLPKFENEMQDAVVADGIVQAADERYMVVSIKHSGSLSTLSYNLIGAKNSINNIFTSTAVILLHAHYQRLPGMSCAPVTCFCVWMHAAPLSYRHVQ